MLAALLFLLLLLFPAPSQAVDGTYNTLKANNFQVTGSVGAGSAPQIMGYDLSHKLESELVTGDCAFTRTGANTYSIACTKTGGTSFALVATTGHATDLTDWVSALASPPAIGTTTPAPGRFSTLGVASDNVVTSMPRPWLSGVAPSTVISAGVDFAVGVVTTAITLEKFDILGTGAETCATPPTIDVIDCGTAGSGTACGSPTSMASTQLSSSSGTSVNTTGFSVADAAAGDEIRLRITNAGACAVPPQVVASITVRPQ
jgi:hypothetical protein